ncbi:MAG: peroxide stress protein YaaA [Terracoccus sp.]
MLILLPPSEGKTGAKRGRPLDLDSLSFPELTAMRRDVVDDVVTASGRPDASSVLGINPNLADQIERNTRLLTAPTAPAVRVYSGVLYQALDHPTLDPASVRRAHRQVVVVSAMFGALHLTDRIPAYRINVCSTLPHAGYLARSWRPVLAAALDAAVRPRELVIDCRSDTYASLWRPSGALAEGWVHVKVPGASHMAKYTRGLVTRELVSGPTPRTLSALVERLGERFLVDLAEPVRPGRPWTLSVNERVGAT